MINIPIAGQIANLYIWALGIGALVALGALIFGGLLYITSAGNASRQDDAKEWIFGAVIGLFILFGSYLILNTINPNLTVLRDFTLEKNNPTKNNPAACDYPGNHDNSLPAEYCDPSLLRQRFPPVDCEGKSQGLQLSACSGKLGAYIVLYGAMGDSFADLDDVKMACIGKYVGHGKKSPHQGCVGIDNKWWVNSNILIIQIPSISNPNRFRNRPIVVQGRPNTNAGHLMFYDKFTISE